LMRWDELFADLEAQADALDQRDRDAEIADRTRAEQATLEVADRLRAAIGHTVTVRVGGVGILAGRVQRVGAAWLLLSTAEEVPWLVAWPALIGVVGVPRRAVAANSAVAAGLGWPSTWRLLARDRALVHVVRCDASTVSGVPERVGRDFVELRVGGLESVPPAGPRGTEHRGKEHAEVVPYAAVAAVRCPRYPTG